MRLKLMDASGQAATVLEVKTGQTFAQAIWLSRTVKTQPLCGGMGLCGGCKIRFIKDPPKEIDKERDFFSPEEIAQGWRLACHHLVPDKEDEVEIFIPDARQNNKRPPTSLIIAEKSFLGIDLGTTSIQWRLVSQEGKQLAEGSLLNPQMAAGPDVISRLKYSDKNENRDRLSDLVLAAISEIIKGLSIGASRPNRLCVAANSVMTHILLKQDLEGLSHAPYYLNFKGGEIVSLYLLGRDLPCVIPPLPGPYIGGDISAGVAALLSMNLKEPILMADLGTNAELALILPDKKLYLASTPLGPAMEGIGPKRGQPAGPGTVVSFSLQAYGLIPKFYDEKEGDFISATGYLSLLSNLLNLGLLDRKGHFTHKFIPLVRNISIGDKKGEESLEIREGLYITASDVELLLKVKASFRLALSRLLEIAGIDEIKTFVLAGAISEHANISDLINLGFIPGEYENKVIIGGNTALTGACILAEKPYKLEELGKLCDSATIIDLANDPSFFHDYLTEMTWL